MKPILTTLSIVFFSVCFSFSQELKLEYMKIDSIPDSNFKKAYVAELNNDGYRDLILVASLNDSTFIGYIYFQTDSLEFTRMDSIKNLSSQFLEIHDIDNSGQIDVLANIWKGEQSYTVALLNYQMSNGFTSKEITQCGKLAELLINDENNDGLKDLWIYSNKTETSELKKLKQKELSSFIVDSIFYNVSIPIATSINFDGIKDLIVQEEITNDLLFITKDNLNGQLKDTLRHSFSIPIHKKRIIDSNHDGSPDLISISYQDDKLVVWSFDQSHDLNGKAEYKTNASEVHYFNTGDYNNDGFYDFILVNDSVHLLLAEDSTGFQFHRNSMLYNSRTKILEASDINDDGILDFFTVDHRDDSTFLSFAINLTNETNKGPILVPIFPPVTIGNKTTFSWSDSKDDKTPLQANSYDFYLANETEFKVTSSTDLINPKRDGFRNQSTIGLNLFDNQFSLFDLSDGKYQWGVAGIDNAYHSNTDIKNCNDVCNNETSLPLCLEISSEEVFACLRDTLKLSLGEETDSVSWFSVNNGYIDSGNTIDFIVSENDTVYAIALPRKPCDDITNACVKNHSVGITTSENIDLIQDAYFFCPDSTLTLSLYINYDETVWYSGSAIISTESSIIINESLTDTILYVKAKMDTSLCFYFDTIQIKTSEPLDIEIFEADLDSACLNTVYSPFSDVSDSISVIYYFNGQPLPVDGILINEAKQIVAEGTFLKCYTFYDTIQVIPINPPVITVEGEKTIYPGKSTHLTAKGGVSYTWTPEAYLSNPFSSSTTATPPSEIVYSVTGINNAGCTGNTSINITVVPSIYIPELFTPNDDGKNDQLLVYGSGVKSISFDLYDGSGRKVFSSNSVSQMTQYGWDGTRNGAKITPGTYLWTISGEFANGIPLTYEGKTSGELKIVR